MADETMAAGTPNAGEGTNPAWMASLPDAHKGNERFAQFTEPSQAWDKFNDFLTRDAEGKLVAIPGETATAEERTAFYRKLGMPESPDKYNLVRPTDLPEGMTLSYEKEKAFKDFCHSKGYSNQTANDLYQWYYGSVLKPAYEQHVAETKAATERQNAEAQAAHDAAVNALKNEWPGDLYQKNTELAHRAASKVIGDKPADKEAWKTLIETPINGTQLGSHPVFVKIFHNLAKAIGEDSPVMGGNGAPSEDLAKSWFPNSPDMHKKQ